MAMAARSLWLDDNNWKDVMRHISRPVRVGLDRGRCWCEGGCARDGLAVAMGTRLVLTNVDRVSAPVVRSRRRGALREPRTTTSRTPTLISTEHVDVGDKENDEPSTSTSGCSVDDGLERTRSRSGLREGVRSNRARRTFSGDSRLRRSINDPLNSRHSLESHPLSNTPTTPYSTVALGPSSSAPLSAIPSPSLSRATGDSRPSGCAPLHISPVFNSPSDDPDTEPISDERSPPNARPKGEEVHSPTLEQGSVRGRRDEALSETQVKQNEEQFQDAEEDQVSFEVSASPYIGVPSKNEDGHHFTLFPDEPEAFDPEEAFEDAEEDESENGELGQLEGVVDPYTLAGLPPVKDRLYPDVREALQRAISPLTLG